MPTSGTETDKIGLLCYVSVYIKIGKKWFFENVENQFFWSNLMIFLRIHLKLSKKTYFSSLQNSF